MSRCEFCYLSPEGEDKQECPFCPNEPDLDGLILTLYVPADDKQRVRLLWMQADWHTRQVSIARVLGMLEGRFAAMDVLEEDEKQRVHVYHNDANEDGELNWRFLLGEARLVLRGNAIMTIMNLASGLEVSFPRRGRRDDDVPADGGLTLTRTIGQRDVKPLADAGGVPTLAAEGRHDEQ